MNVLVVEPGMAPYEKEIDGLKDMQAIVGGKGFLRSLRGP